MVLLAGAARGEAAEGRIAGESRPTGQEPVAHAGAIAAFQARVNQQPFVLADRLWVKDRLDPEEEKLRFSN